MNTSSKIDSIRDFLRHCRDEYAELRITFQTHHIIFEQEDSDKLLREIAPQFFAFLARALQEYYILQVCRMTDPAETIGKTNFTHKRLNQLLDECGLLTTEIEAISKELDAYRELVLSAWNRLVAHRDEKTVLSQQLLGAHGRDEMDKFLCDLNRYCDAVAKSLWDCYLQHGVEEGELNDLRPQDMRWIPGDGDEQDLMKALEDYRNWKRQFDQGEIPSPLG